MRTFKLGAVEFQVKIDAPKVQLIRAKCQLDLASSDCSQFEKLSADPVLAQTVLWYLCESQVKDVGMTDAAFFDLLAGDGGEDAGAQLFEAIIDFFPNRQQREALRRMLAANVEAVNLTSQGVVERIAAAKLPQTLAKKALAEFDQRIAEMLGMPSSSATDLPESSAAE